MDTKEIILMDTKVYYERYQSLSEEKAETVVLVHGFLSSCFSFRRLIPLLVKQYHVVAVDLPGFGKSEKAVNFYYSLENYGQLLILLLEKLHLSKIILTGHSMGGQVVLHTARKRPELVSKLVLICSSGYIKPSNKALIFCTYLPFFHLLMEKWIKKKDIKKNIARVVYDHSLVDQELIDGYSSQFKERAFYQCLIRLARQREGDLSTVELNKINIPALLIWGKEDHLVPLRVGKRMARDLLDSKLIVLEKTGHLVPEEKPDEVFEAMKRFISE
ncbi:alpha/beta hydrolase [Pseudalkalibacillus caeni]|uniref:Alpha/beta hydrolase n=2 Tax=Exobacillus caeni TaxID=2574798 RepID=A0A5R9FEU6_9BACL|nr:alpha/beta hydrolase [Pseudalkalibacillus caeni]